MATVYKSSDTSGGITATLSAQNDAAQLAVKGSEWASLIVTFVTAGSGGATFQYSKDAGTNWLAAPYGTRIDDVQANPAVAPFSNNTPVAGVWEVFLPGNCNFFRVLYATAGTDTVVNIGGYDRYVPGIPVKSVIYDVATTAGAVNNTPTLDVAGWTAVGVDMVVTSATTGAASLNEVDDAGTAIALGTNAGITVNTYAFGWGGSYSFGTANPFTMKGAITSAPLPPRISLLVAGATTSATRTRIVASR